MAMRLSGTFGFITNSSSVVYHFPRAILEDPDIQAFITAYGIQDGYVGEELWHRGQCQTFAVTQEQKRAANRSLASLDSDYGYPPGVDTEGDDVVLVYGDEYDDITAHLIRMFEQVAQRENISYGSQDYN